MKKPFSRIAAATSQLLQAATSGKQPEAVAAPIPDFNHSDAYDKAIKPHLDAIGAIMDEVGMNGFTMFEVARIGEVVKLEGQNWENNPEGTSFQRYLCIRIATDLEFVKRLQKVLHILDAPDSEIMRSMMGLKDQKIMGTTH